jgi:integrase
MRFTEANVKAFVIPAGKVDHHEWDDSMPGFGFRCRTAGGSKVYLVKYRVGSKQRKVMLGATNKVTLETARANARQLFGKVAMNEDPANELARKALDASQTFGSIVPRYLAIREGEVTAGHYRATKLALEDRFKRLHTFALPAIERSTVATELHTQRTVNGPVAMNRNRSYLSHFFNWCIGEGLCSINPVDKTNKAEETSVDRVLEDSEIKAVWRALPDSDFGKIMKLLALTAQRRSEIGELRVSEFNRAERQIELPGERTKNGLPHVVPLSDAAMSILESVDMDGRKFVFGRSVEKPFAGYGKAKETLDVEVKIPHWTIHDLRRTGSTRMGDEGVLPHVVEAVINHQSGSKSGVAGIYNKAKYLTEKREALQTLASFIERIVS